MRTHKSIGARLRRAPGVFRAAGLLLLPVLLLLGVIAGSRPARALDAPHDAAPGPTGCSDCHSTHAALGMSLIAREYVQDLCVACHDGVTAAEADTHTNPTDADSPWYGRDFDGGGQDIICTDCHEPHSQRSALGEHFVGFRDTTLGNILRRSPEGPVPILYDGTGYRSAYVKLDPDGPYGICEACHTATSVYRKGGTADDHSGTRSCLDCHAHRNGFRHSGGSDCGECHGHDPGYGGVTGGAGTYAVHSTHTEGDADDLRGPNVGCATCHDVQRFPDFADGATRLEDTAVCDTCHSPGGDHDGVDDPAIGAKVSWATGVYAGGALLEGKERWCVGCHDNAPANSAADGTGVAAPAIAGDATAATSYGIGYGYYASGHGLPAEETYPATAGTVAGAGLGCGACHDLAAKHIDGIPRTYVRYAAPGAADDYRHGYRLRTVGAAEPLVVPRVGTCNETPRVKSTDFALCVQCHDSGPYTTATDLRTNYRRAGSSSGNAHYVHLAVNSVCDFGPMFSSDWSYEAWDSRATCVTCHNVHGSRQLAMVRDGSLVGKEPGIRVSYYDPSVTYACGSLPAPGDVSLPESTGTVWDRGGLRSLGLCETCHGSCGYDAVYLRSPYDGSAPRILYAYGAVGSASVGVRFSERVYTGPGAAGGLVPGDLAFSGGGRTVVSVGHEAGDRHAVATLSGPLDAVGSATLAAATDASIYDLAGNAMDTTAVVVGADGGAPLVTGRSPADGAVDVPAGTPLAFVLEDEESGVDWASVSIAATGDAGYSRTWGAASPAVVAIGTPRSYAVTVTPDPLLGALEEITVTVTVSDVVGNPRSASWTFTTVAAGVPQTIALHPFGLAENPGAWQTAPGADDWAAALDSEDGDGSYATSAAGSAGAWFSVDADDTTAVVGSTVTGVTVHVLARYVDGFSPVPPCVAGNLALGFDTGAGVVWDVAQATPASCDYVWLSSPTWTTDSGGQPLDEADVQGLRIAVRRLTSGSALLRITEAFVVVDYVP